MQNFFVDKREMIIIEFMEAYFSSKNGMPNGIVKHLFTKY